MKVSGPSKSGAARGVAKSKGTAKTAGEFQVTNADREAGGVSASSSITPVETLSALINLQSDSGASRGKLIAAGQRALTLLDRIQQGLLDGRIYVRDLEALAQDAKRGGEQLRSETDHVQAELAALYNDISLRARIELAKLGH